MSRYSGKQIKGAARLTKEWKRKQAEDRNARTAPERRRSYRRVTA